MRLRIGSWSALCMLLCAACSQPDPLCLGCSYILISVDALRQDHLGIYGYPRDTSPNIDRFFESGTSFDNATTSAPCTRPAVLQFLTSSFDFSASRPRLAEVMKQAGFSTAAITTQHHFLTPDRSQPLDDYRRGFDSFGITGHHHRGPIPGSELRPSHENCEATEITDAAVRWLDAHDGQPFFLWLHYYDPHDPYAPPKEHRLLSASPPDVLLDHRILLKEEAERNPEIRKWSHAGHILSKEQREHLVALYDGEVHYVDSQIGRFLDHLKQRKLLESSVVVLTSDHGERLGERNRWDHCDSLSSEEINVPLLVSYKGGPLAGASEVRSAVSTLDIMPTLLELAGIASPKPPLLGVSLRVSPSDRKVVIPYRRQVVVHDRNWKLYMPDQSGRVALYNVVLDPRESQDVARQNPEVVGRLSAAAKNLGLQEIHSLTQEIHEQLRAIGYAD